MKVSRPPTLEPPAPEVEIVGTRAAARSLNRQPRTLQSWAREGTGPIKPISIHGRYAWPVGQIKRILGGG